MTVRYGKSSRGTPPTPPYSSGRRMRVAPAPGHLAVHMITNGAVDRTVQNWIADEVSRSTATNTIAVLVRVTERSLTSPIVMTR
ncbi:hypothetical protein [Streptomyces microflavus]|uniref:hypothetical protein n=1 Tax=Streptomyces microflavus TaxID=1919 RepID=UPI003636DB28